MKAIIYYGVGDIRCEDVDEPEIEQPTDAIVRITASAVCGTDLHMARGTLGVMKEGTILGHEGVGIIEALGPQVRNFRVGDRVMITPTISCGFCSYCRAGYYAQCDNANPKGKLSGTAFFGGPESSGPFHGLQAERARIPFASNCMVALPDAISDDQAVLITDMFSTGYFGAEVAEVRDGDTVAVFGCGPVGLFSVISAKLQGAGRVFAVDNVKGRLEMAQSHGAEIINFDEEDPVEVIRELTGGIGVDRVIEAVGIDAQPPNKGPAKDNYSLYTSQFEQESNQLPDSKISEKKGWSPGHAPSLSLRWAVEAVDKAGTLGIVGVYPDAAHSFPIGMAIEKNLTINMGNCNHRKYFPHLIGLVESGVVDPLDILTHIKPLTFAPNVYKELDSRDNGWVKVEIVPGMTDKGQ
ncbi:alcohol dehydrogenase catalytic domain-containing protein [Chitinispirillales bacterium ANBcel5]|uniref:alcohol dehydrogenase catalytic domain-containing protein n=1 Tax=Cellulosispirillum alkaliphilum TaxID=3039283 RepID=UPI002A53054C|nr:alcohol dehydrogenase catalytic domain-containing protein [Chitinispirillales bacterium ANBcel5]